MGWDSWTHACGDFAQLQQGSAPHDRLGKIVRYGFAKVMNAPVEPGALFRVVDLFGYVRETIMAVTSKCGPR